MTALNLKLLRDLWHMRGQALAIAAVLAAAAATFVLSMSLHSSLVETRRAYYDQSNFADVMVELTRAPRSLIARVAQIPEVRVAVNAECRRVALERDVVVDGRDIGNVVFPDAQLKIFLIADPWERASRRLLQRLGRPGTDDESAEETKRLVERDARDATQTVQALDAVLIDTTHLTQEEQVHRIVTLAHHM